MMSFLLATAGEVALTVLGTAASAATNALQGQSFRQFSAVKGRQVRSLLAEKLKLDPPPPATNHDLQRALCQAFCETGQRWLNDLAALPEQSLDAAEAETLPAFVRRARAHLGSTERASFDRQEDFDSQVSETLMASVVSSVPEANLASADLDDVALGLKEAFSGWIQGLKDGALPPTAVLRLGDTAGDGGPNLFGHRVLQCFIEIIKSGDYMEATRAFDQRVAGDIRDAVEELSGRLNASMADRAFLEGALKDIANNVDQISLTAAVLTRAADRMEQTAQKVLDLTGRIEQRQLLLGQLVLDRKPVGQSDLQPFLQMTFSQRRTRFSGRHHELDRLAGFLAEDSQSDRRSRFQWWQIAGDGGQGKSRLALQLIDRLGCGWDAGFLSATELETFDWQRGEFPRPTLIVIDYAAAPEKAQKVVDAIDGLIARAVSGHPNQLTAPVRLLVLERAGYDLEATPEQNDGRTGASMNWLSVALGRSASGISLKEAAHRTTPLWLGPLQPHEITSIGHSWRYYRKLPPLDQAGEDRVLKLLQGSGGAARARAWRPLFAMMYAEAQDQFDLQENSELEATVLEILSRTFGNERLRQWPKSSGNPAPIPEAAQNLACLATMIGGVDVDRLHDDLFTKLVAAGANETDSEATLNDVYGDLSHTDGDAAFHMLGYPSTGRNREHPAFPAREPDLLGEYMVIWSLSGISNAQKRRSVQARAKTLVDHAVRLDAQSLIGFLIRLREDYPTHPVTHLLAATDWPEIKLSYSNLQFPAYHGLIGALKKIISDGADPNQRDPGGGFPLLFAATKGHDECVQLLLDAKAEPDRVDSENGAFPLVMAAKNGHAECVRLLLEADAQPLPFYEATVSEVAPSVVVRPGRPDLEFPPLLPDHWLYGTAAEMPQSGALSTWLHRRFGNKVAICGWRSRGLQCVTDGTLLELGLENGGDRLGELSVILWPSGVLHLDGTSEPFHVLRGLHRHDMRLDDPGTITEWLRLFCTSLTATEGAFVIVESADQLSLTQPGQVELPDEVLDKIRPLTFEKADRDGAYFAGTMAYGGVLFSVTMRVSPDGNVAMLDDDPIAADLPIYNYGFDGPFRTRWKGHRDGGPAAED